MTTAELGSTIKQKYPQYANYSDEEVGKKMLEKYPVYKQKIDQQVSLANPVAPQKSTLAKAAGITTGIFGSGKLGEYIGLKAAQGKLGTTAQRLLAGRDLSPEEEAQIAGDKGPTGKQIAGSVAQSALLFAPAGTITKGAVGAARAVGLARGASAIGKIAAGAGIGYGFDVATNYAEGKTGAEAKKPGIGTLIGGAIPAAGVAKNITKRTAAKSAPRVINSLIKPLAKDFSYGKNPGRAVAESKIVANNWDDLIEKIRTTRGETGRKIGELTDNLTPRTQLNLSEALDPLNVAIKTAAKQNNQSLVSRLNNVKQALVNNLDVVYDDAGTPMIQSVGQKNITNANFKEAREFLQNVGDLTSFTGNPSDDKLINSALKRVYGNAKELSLNAAQKTDPKIAKQFSKLTEKYADLTSAGIAAQYRDKILERQALIGFSPKNVGIASGLFTLVASGGATLPAMLVGLGAAGLDKVMATPAFKTRLASMLAQKSADDVARIVQKLPALQKFLSTEKGAFPGDRLLKTKLGQKVSGVAKDMPVGMSIKDVSRQPLRGEAGKFAGSTKGTKLGAMEPKAWLKNNQPDIQTLDALSEWTDYVASGKKDYVYEGHFRELLDSIGLKSNQPNGKIRDMVSKILDAADYGKQIPKGKGAIPELAEEAKKYKSAEEFVRAQGKSIYHGTAGKFDVFDDAMKGSVTGAKSAHGATWFTDNPDVARAYSVYAAESGPINKLLKQHDALEKIAQKSGKKADWARVDKLTQEIDDLGGYDATYQRRLDHANVKEAFAKGDFYTVDAKGKTPQELSADGDIDSWLDLQVKEAKKLGKDGLIIKNLDDAVGLYDRPSTHYAFFDSKKITTKSQLTDIWNKAHKK